MVFDASSKKLFFIPDPVLHGISRRVAHHRSQARVAPHRQTKVHAYLTNPGGNGEEEPDRQPAAGHAVRATPAHGGGTGSAERIRIVPV